MKQNRLILNTESVKKRLNGDSFLFEALYRIYTKQIKIYMQDIENSLNIADHQHLASCTHSLESCFQTVGAELCEDANKHISNALSSGTWENIPQLVDKLRNELEFCFNEVQRLGLVH